MDESERQRLRQIANSAELGFWPPHLGLNTDVQRIEFLATKLHETLNAFDNAIEGMKDEIREDFKEKIESAIA